MSYCSAVPSCWGLFSPLAGECAACARPEDCMKEQERSLLDLLPSAAEEETIPAPPPKAKAAPAVRQPPAAKPPLPSLRPTPHGAQVIPKHLRQPLEIPPVGTQLQAWYKGELYLARVVEDPSNPRFGRRAVEYNGSVYKTLTAAAHAIAPGINSGSVWHVA